MKTLKFMIEYTIYLSSCMGHSNISLGSEDSFLLFFQLLLVIYSYWYDE